MTGHDFEQHLISGYLDGELTQQQEQRVRIHLEDCAECRTLADELSTMKEATMTIEFQVPPDTQWDETPTSPSTRWLQRVGWAVASIWLLVTAGYGITQMIRDVDNLIEVIITFGVWAGIGLVFLAVAIDQLRKRPTDRYRSVRK